MDKQLPFKKRLSVRIANDVNTQTPEPGSSSRQDIQPEPSYIQDPQPGPSYTQHSSYSSTSSSSSSSNNNLLLKNNRLKHIILENKFIEIENAFKSNLRTYFYKNNNNVIKDICLLLIYFKLEILNILSNMIVIYNEMCIRDRILPQSNMDLPHLVF